MKSGLIVDSEGNKRWYFNGEFHREDGPAIEYADGTKHWYLNDKFHREEGPAVEHADGSKFWWLNGERHREDGPAITFTNGTNYWYLNDKEYSEKEYQVEIQRRKDERIKKEEHLKEIRSFNYKLESLKL